MIDGAYNTCRKNVKFVHVQLSVNFIDLVTIDNPGTNGAGRAYNLTTFPGTADLRTLTSQEIQAKILDFTLQYGPVKLQAASFGATSARTDSFAIRADIQEKILLLSLSRATN